MSLPSELKQKYENFHIINLIIPSIVLFLIIVFLMVFRWLIISKSRKRALPQHILASLPISQVGSTDDNVCVICLDGFMENDIVKELPPCSHTFHRQCINKWFKTNNYCPICRRSLLEMMIR
ncbi:hypothetical protein AMTRI_Chr05g64160 [Amborella trichopoda]